MCGENRIKFRDALFGVLLKGGNQQTALIFKRAVNRAGV
ncbi:Uncharacterised protein [Vibrio cholerae]|nr:Uncharacterised protein [Vibrio cholerae]CSC46423.1 Uncharacterised protein [Vibrio cholerae]